MTAFPRGRGANVRLNPLNAPANRRKVMPQAKLPPAEYKSTNNRAARAERRVFFFSTKMSENVHIRSYLTNYCAVCGLLVSV